LKEIEAILISYVIIQHNFDDPIKIIFKSVSAKFLDILKPVF